MCRTMKICEKNAIASPNVSKRGLLKSLKIGVTRRTPSCGSGKGNTSRRAMQRLRGSDAKGLDDRKRATSSSLRLYDGTHLSITKVPSDIRVASMVLKPFFERVSKRNQRYMIKGRSHRLSGHLQRKHTTSLSPSTKVPSPDGNAGVTCTHFPLTTSAYSSTLVPDETIYRGWRTIVACSLPCSSSRST